MPGAARGFTQIELLVAVTIFAIAAAALAQTLVTAQRSRTSSGRWMQATQLAEERLERLRAGDRQEDGGPLGGFTRSWQTAPVPDTPRLERIDIVVTWEDCGARRFALSALMRVP